MNEKLVSLLVFLGGAALATNWSKIKPYLPFRTLEPKEEEKEIEKEEILEPKEREEIKVKVGRPRKRAKIFSLGKK